MSLLQIWSKWPRAVLSFRNCGFGDNLLAAANAWYYAKQTGRTLIILWVRSRYSPDPTVNVFGLFFAVPSEIAGVRVEIYPRGGWLTSVLLAYWHLIFPYPDLLSILERFGKKTGLIRFLAPVYVPIEGPRGFRFDKRQAKEQDRVYAGKDKHQRLHILAGCYSPREGLRPFFDSLQAAPELARRIDAFSETHFRGKIVIGLHIRYYDPSLPASNHTEYWIRPEESLKQCLARVQSAVAEIRPAEYIIFLATDSGPVQDYMQKNLDHLVTVEKRFGSPDKQLHDELAIETAAESVMEMFLLARSDVLIRFPASWFSHYASLYAKRTG